MIPLFEFLQMGQLSSCTGPAPPIFRSLEVPCAHCKKTIKAGDPRISLGKKEIHKRLGWRTRLARGDRRLTKTPRQKSMDFGTEFGISVNYPKRSQSTRRCLARRCLEAFYAANPRAASKLGSDPELHQCGLTGLGYESAWRSPHYNILQLF